MSAAPSPSAGWIPIDAHWCDGALTVDWCHLGATPLREPFFEDSLAKCLGQPFNQLFRPRTPIETLADFAESEPGLAPSGFIFHMSRCGSTLVAQMLASLPQSVVLSEASPLDAALRAESDPPPGEAERVAWLRWMMSALGQRRRGDETRLFVKFDCWHALQLPVIRKAFPHVPCVFLYREPVAALHSQLRRRGAFTVPGLLPPGIFGIDREAAPRMPAEEYCARILAAICDAARRAAAAGALRLVNYAALPAAAAEIAGHFAVDCGAVERAAMAEVALSHAYRPGTPFVAAAGGEPMPPRARAAAETWLAPVYEALEALRLAQRDVG